MPQKIRDGVLAVKNNKFLNPDIKSDDKQL